MDTQRTYYYRGRRIDFRDHALKRCEQRHLSAEYVAHTLAYCLDGGCAPGIYRQTVVNFIALYEQFADHIEIITLYKIKGEDERVGKVEVERRMREYRRGGGRSVRKNHSCP